MVGKKAGSVFEISKKIIVDRLNIRLLLEAGTRYLINIIIYKLPNINSMHLHIMQSRRKISLKNAHYFKKFENLIEIRRLEEPDVHCDTTTPKACRVLTIK
jgi:hypothetical protein